MPLPLADGKIEVQVVVRVVYQATLQAQAIVKHNKMPASATLILSVGSYLRFELSHNYRPGAESVHWTLKQFNGSAEPMVMPLYGGIEIMEPLLKHLTHEMNYYAPPVEQSIVIPNLSPAIPNLSPAIPNLSPAQRELQRLREQQDAPLQNDVLPQHIQVDGYKNGVHINIRLENRHAISYEGAMFIPKCPPGAFNFVRPLHNNLSLSEFTARFQPLFELFAYMVEDSVV